MTTPASDPVRKASIRAAIILAIGLICGGASWQWQVAAAQKQTDFQRQMNHLRSEVARLRQDRQWTETYQPNYQRLVNNGLIGKESRLEWRALIIDIAQQLHLPEVKISFKPRQLLEPTDSEFNSGQRQANSYQSQMSVDLALFHSLDLLPLLYSLDHSASAILLPVRCSMTLDNDPLYLTADPMIKSHCDLNWVTIEPTPAEQWEEF